MIEIKCKGCGKPFNISPSRFGKKFFCSSVCYAPYRKSGLVKNGRKTQFKRGHEPFSKLNPDSMPRGSEHKMWKGDSVSYRGLHYWIRRVKGNPTKCSECGKEKTTPKSIQWANVSGDYLRDVSDYIALCASCHKIYDSSRPIQR